MNRSNHGVGPRFRRRSRVFERLYSALIPNAKGFRRAAEAGVGQVEITISATDSHNRNNLNSTTEESIARLRSCVDLGLGVRIVVGVAVFDTSIAGLGGCPYAPGATGNLATEDLVMTMEEMGIDTGIDHDRLMEASRFTAEAIGHSDSHALRAGGRMKDRRAAHNRLPLREKIIPTTSRKPTE